jgi:FAR-17a/AIG1-like protein
MVLYRVLPWLRIGFGLLAMVAIARQLVLLLRNVDLGSLRPWVNFVLHIVMPCVVVVDWLAAPPRKKLDSHILLRLLIFPVVYLAYVLIRGSQVGWYPYPFLDPARPGGYPSVIGYAAGIAATFVLVALMTITVGNKLMSRPSR